VEVKLLDSTDKEVSAGQVGEIVVRGPNVMMGYYGQPEETEKVLKKGWLYTGDLAWADEDGYLYIAGRKKDMIISGGENITSREVEDVLFTYPDVLKAAVFGVPDDKWGERVVAAIVPREGRQPVLKEVQEYLKGQLAGYKIPKEIILLDQLPEGSTGKVQKQELKKIYQRKQGEGRA
jgi:acyl-CoA synthetase (AMP-forming)/AMP-acid ligase II